MQTVNIKYCSLERTCI